MSKKKKLTENEGNEDNTRVIEGLNTEMRRYLVRLGWNNPNIQNDFISVVNSFILSGENPTLQKMITTYLKKGLDVLNLEMNKQDLMTKQSVSRVDSEDVAEEEGEINESLIKEANRKRNINVHKRNSILDGITEVRKRLIDAGFNIRESGVVVNRAMRMGNTASTLRAMRLITEDRQQETEVYKTNFNTFYRLYLTDTYDWSTDPLMNLIGTIMGFIEKGENSASNQTQMVLKVEDLQKLLSNNIKSFDKSAEENKNLDTARSELRKFAVIDKGWKQEEFSKLFSLINDLAINSRNVNIQRRIAQKLSEIESSFTKKEPEEPAERPKEEKPKQQSAQKAEKPAKSSREPKTEE